jgi:hypothetical protein
MDRGIEVLGFSAISFSWRGLVTESLLWMTVYWPRYQPIPYRSKKLVMMVSELA